MSGTSSVWSCPRGRAWPGRTSWTERWWSNSGMFPDRLLCHLTALQRGKILFDFVNLPPDLPQTPACFPPVCGKSCGKCAKLFSAFVTHIYYVIPLRRPPGKKTGKNPILSLTDRPHGAIMPSAQESRYGSPVLTPGPRPKG